MLTCVLIIAFIFVQQSCCSYYCIKDGGVYHVCDRGCFYGYTVGGSYATQGCLPSGTSLSNGECKADVTVGGAVHGFGCACNRGDNCNNRQYMSIHAACAGLYGIEPGSSLFGDLSTCECAKKNAIECSHGRHGKITRLCSSATANSMCPGFD